MRSTAENWPRKPSWVSTSRSSGWLTVTGAGGGAMGLAVSREEAETQRRPAIPATATPSTQGQVRDRLPPKGSAPSMSDRLVISFICLSADLRKNDGQVAC